MTAMPQPCGPVTEALFDALARRRTVWASCRRSAGATRWPTTTFSSPSAVWTVRERNPLRSPLS